MLMHSTWHSEIHQSSVNSDYRIKHSDMYSFDPVSRVFQAGGFYYPFMTYLPAMLTGEVNIK